MIKGQEKSVIYGVAGEPDLCVGISCIWQIDFFFNVSKMRLSFVIFSLNTLKLNLL